MGEIMFLKGRVPLEEFIEFHTKHHHSYCEAVIHSNGDCEYAIPSHQQKLIELTGLHPDVVWEMIDPADDVLKYLCNYTNCVSVWFDFQYLPDTTTDEQQHALIRLAEERCIILSTN